MTCRILSNFYSYSMQVLLALLTFSTLFIKRNIEYPKRDYKVFIYDISKQVFSGIFAHSLNIFFAIKLSLKFQNIEDECKVYFINFFCDVIFGLPISYLLTQLVNYLAKKYDKAFIISGNYPENLKIVSYEYVLQTTIWIFIVLIYKIIVLYGIIIPGYKSWGKFGDFIISSLTHNTHIELFLVMVMFPFIFNVIQYWITDHFLKGKGWIKKPYTPDIPDINLVISENDYDEL